MSRKSTPFRASCSRKLVAVVTQKVDDKIDLGWRSAGDSATRAPFLANNTILDSLYPALGSLTPCRRPWSRDRDKEIVFIIKSYFCFFVAGSGLIRANSVSGIDPRYSRDKSRSSGSPDAHFKTRRSVSARGLRDRPRHGSTIISQRAGIAELTFGSLPR